MDLTVFPLLMLVCFPALVWSHARLMSPPSRSSMWRLGFPTRKNFNDNALYCGGISIQWQKNGGKCGICGDPYDMPHPRDNEAGGKYGRGIISGRYLSGQVIEATVDVTTNHRGYFEFKLCPNNNPKKEATQECLDIYILKEAHGIGTRYYIGDRGNGDITVKLQLPKGLTCSQCVFQWTYVAGNNWGKCEDGFSRLGCGPQETFRGCADISIVKNSDIFNIKFNENDVGNKRHKVHSHKNRKHGQPKDISGTKHPDYVYEVSKNSRKNVNRTYFDPSHNHSHPHYNPFHQRNGDYLPPSTQTPENRKKRPVLNERGYNGEVNRRKYNKYDNRHFHRHSNHPSHRENLPGREISVNSNRGQIRDGRNNSENGNRNWQQKQHSRKRQNIGRPRSQDPERHLALMMSSESDEDDSLQQGFNLGGRRYKDFWLL